jgi:hypothetical protein
VRTGRREGDVRALRLADDDDLIFAAVRVGIAVCRHGRAPSGGHQGRILREGQGKNISGRRARGRASAVGTSTAARAAATRAAGDSAATARPATAGAPSSTARAPASAAARSTPTGATATRATATRGASAATTPAAVCGVLIGSPRIPRIEATRFRVLLTTGRYCRGSNPQNEESASADGSRSRHIAPLVVTGVPVRSAQKIPPVGAPDVPSPFQRRAAARNARPPRDIR